MSTAMTWLRRGWACSPTILRSPHHASTGDLAEQQYLGLRDTIRTRELLIEGGIPLGALRRASAGRVLPGIGSGSNALNQGRWHGADGVEEPGAAWPDASR